MTWADIRKTGGRQSYRLVGTRSFKNEVTPQTPTGLCDSDTYGKSVSDDDAKCVAAATVSSRLDCCNSVLCGTSRLNISKLHRAQNMLARAIQVGKEIRARNTSRRRVHFPTYAMLGHTKQRIGQIGRIYRCETNTASMRWLQCSPIPSRVFNGYRPLFRQPLFRQNASKRRN